MSNFERYVIAIAMLLSLFWGGGLFVAFMLKDQQQTSTSHEVLVEPSSTHDDVQAQTEASAGAGALSFPKPGQDTLPVNLTVVEKRAKLEAVWNQPENRQARYMPPHGRWEDRTGTIMSQPTTAPSNEATLISVHISKASLHDAMAAVARAAGMKITLVPAYAWQQSSFPSITLDANSRPLLEVLNELSCRAGLTTMSETGWEVPALADPAARLAVLRIQQPDDSMGPWVVSGPFAFEVQEVNHTAQIDPATHDDAMATLTMAVQHEPKVTLLGQRNSFDLTEAIDEKGNSLLTTTDPQGHQPTKWLSWSGAIRSAIGGPTATAVDSWGETSNAINIPLRCPPNCGRMIAKLTGSMAFLVQSKSERFEAPVTPSAADTEKTVEGLRVAAGSWQINSPNQCTGRIKFYRGDLSSRQWRRFRAAVSNLNPVLLDATGKPLPAARRSGSSSDDAACWAQFYWTQQSRGNDDSGTLKPAKLVLDVPTAFEVVQVPVHFENLPLP